MPQASIDPVVMAAATVLRLQTIVSREVAADRGRRRHRRRAAGRHEGERHPRRGDHQAERAHLRRGRAQARARRDRADRECRGRGVGRARSRRRSRRSTAIRSYATTRTRRERVADAFRRHFAADGCGRPDPRRRARTSGRSAPSGTSPSVFWFVGGTDPDVYAKAKAAGRLDEIPTNHNPRFAPVIHPTLETGVEALVVAAPGVALDVRLISGQSAISVHPCQHAGAGARPGRHVRLRAQRRDGGDEAPARPLRRAGAVVRGGECRRHHARSADRSGAAGSDRRLAISRRFACSPA